MSHNLNNLLKTIEKIIKYLEDNVDDDECSCKFCQYKRHINHCECECCEFVEYLDDIDFECCRIFPKLTLSLYQELRMICLTKMKLIKIKNLTDEFDDKYISLKKFEEMLIKKFKNNLDKASKDIIEYKIKLGAIDYNLRMRQMENFNEFLVRMN